MKALQKILSDRLRHACASGPIDYRTYIDLALYAENCGYYTRQAERVGRSADRDFYTAESLGPVFARLVTTAAVDLIGKTTAKESTFIEIGAEPGAELLNHLKTSPFKADQALRPGDPICPTGPVVIFANEWLDALPFHRLRFVEDRWRERGVHLTADGALIDVLLDAFSAPVAAIEERLPKNAPDGYEIDLPLAAEAALAGLLAQDWTGLILLFDYGKTWKSLTEDCPAGTGRTFYRHTRGDDLLDQPGERDITCDVCWDPLYDQLREAGLDSVTLESQESFFVQRAQRAAEAIVSQGAGGFSRERQTLMELIHPAHMGQRFQILWGIRKV